MHYDVPSRVEEAWPAAAWQEVNVAVALSGGADSVGLLRAMLELKQRAGGAGDVCALHVNHRIRTEESDQDAAWCGQLCQSLGVDLTVIAGDAVARAARDGDGLEAAARAERYELLARAAGQAGARYLATAHTREDQVETVLMRMLRGAGLRGLSGIPRARRLTPSLTLIRPLLDVSRESLLAYLDELRQDFRSDSSNAKLEFTRNRVRHRLLPLLRTRFDAEIDEQLLRLAKQSRESQHLIENRATEILTACRMEHTETQISLRMEPLGREPDIVACEVMRIVWREAGRSEQAMTYRWWRRLARLTGSEVLNLPGNLRASIQGGRLVLQW